MQQLSMLDLMMPPPPPERALKIVEGRAVA